MQRQELAAAEEKELKWNGSVKKLEMSNNIIVCAYFSFFQMKENLIHYYYCLIFIFREKQTTLFVQYVVIS